MTRRAVNFASFVLVMFYTLCAVLLVSMGVNIYRHVRAQAEGSDALRVSINYIQNKLRAGDIEGAISVETRNDTEILVLKYDGSDECETLVYYMNGCLMEMFKFTDSDIDLAFGTKLCEANAFSISRNGRVIEYTITDTKGNEHAMTYTLNCTERTE